MGLDNGWLVKSTKRKLTRADLPSTIRYPFENDYYDDNEIEIAYGRKYWGLRTDLLNNINWDEATEYRYRIDNPEHILDVIEIIASWMGPRWDEEGNSIWTYEEARYNLINWIVNLSSIYAYMQNNPDVYLEFYDSY